MFFDHCPSFRPLGGRFPWQQLTMTQAVNFRGALVTGASYRPVKPMNPIYHSFIFVFYYILLHYFMSLCLGF